MMLLTSLLCLFCSLWKDFTPSSCVFIGQFKQVNVYWIKIEKAVVTQV